jgi:hypothetical protein
MLTSLSQLDDQQLLAQLPHARAAERKATAEVIACLAEVDRRRLYLAEACSSLHTFCVLRLGYSESEAQKRIQVARLAQRLPKVLEELANGSMHLTGLFVLSSYLTDQNADALLAEARAKSRREIEAVIARWFPRSDLLPSITPLSPPSIDVSVASPGTSDSPAVADQTTQAITGSTRKFRIEPLSASSYRIEFTASAALRDKIEQTRNMLGHTIPSGDLAQLFERAIDALLLAETKRRMGTASGRRRRELKPHTRHVPVEVARAVWERDGFQCTFVDAQGRRCAERRFLTLEHHEPFARGGPSSVDNLCVLCAPHNAERARDEFGAAHIEAKRLEASAHEKTLSALVGLGFKKREAKSALETLRRRREKPELEMLLRGALALLMK